MPPAQVNSYQAGNASTNTSGQPSSSGGDPRRPSQVGEAATNNASSSNAGMSSLSLYILLQRKILTGRPSCHPGVPKRVFRRPPEWKTGVQQQTGRQRLLGENCEKCDRHRKDRDAGLEGHRRPRWGRCPEDYGQAFWPEQRWWWKLGAWPARHPKSIDIAQVVAYTHLHSSGSSPLRNALT